VSKFLKFIGLACLAIVCVSVGALVISASIGPEISVYTGRQVPKRFMTTIRSLDLIQKDEHIKYFYSDAMFDIKSGFYFITDRKLVIYSDQWEEPEIIIPFDQIASVDAQYDDSFFDDTMVYVTTDSGLEVYFPVSSEQGLDKRFVQAIEEKLDGDSGVAETDNL
jgi:hypothetical protein